MKLTISWQELGLVDAKARLTFKESRHEGSSYMVSYRCDDGCTQSIQMTWDPQLHHYCVPWVRIASDPYTKDPSMCIRCDAPEMTQFLYNFKKDDNLRFTRNYDAKIRFDGEWVSLHIAKPEDTLHQDATPGQGLVPLYHNTSRQKIELRWPEYNI